MNNRNFIVNANYCHNAGKNTTKQQITKWIAFNDKITKKNRKENEEMSIKQEMSLQYTLYSKLNANEIHPRLAS